MGKTVKSRKSAAVQGTNDCSSISKASMVHKGYFEDEFIQYFIKKQGSPTIRSPLINRGYYIRNYILNKIICDFLYHFNQLGIPIQIISIGSGFDTTFFRLKQQSLLSTGSLFVEVDFAELQQRKLDLIKTVDKLINLIGGNTNLKNQKSSIFWNSSCYKMIGCDLIETSNLLALFREVGLNLNAPTLFLSEVVLTYLNVQDASNLIYWTSKTFNNATFLTYEQVYPFDEFGDFMCKHFIKLGSPLKSILSFPSLQSQVDRYLDLGWESCTASTLSNFLHSFLPSKELQKIERLEMFDEFEEWILKCNHYFILIAIQGGCKNFYQSVKDYSFYEESMDSLSFNHLGTNLRKSKYLIETGSLNKDADSDYKYDYLASNVELTDFNCSRYAHSSCIITHQENRYVLVIGGFGNAEIVPNADGDHKTYFEPNPNLKHSRLKQMNIFNLRKNGCLLNSIAFTSNLFERMHSSCTSLLDGRVLVFGGRKSPHSPMPEVLLLTFAFDPCLRLEGIFVAHLNGGSHMKFKEKDDNKDTNHIADEYKSINNIDQGPSPRWRHSATAIKMDQEDLSTKELIYIHGGITNDNKILSDTWCLDTSTWTWNKISTSSNSPGALHSHSSDWWKNGHALVLTGGINQCGQLQNSIYILNLESLSWKIMLFEHLDKRFSHTMQIHGDDLIIVGGVSVVHPSPGISIINLSTMVTKNFQVPRTIEKINGASCEFHSHTSHLLIPDNEAAEMKILILGGGGNYFSFGTKVRQEGLCLKLT